MLVSRSEPSRSEPSRSEASRSEPSRSEPSRSRNERARLVALAVVLLAGCVDPSHGTVEIGSGSLELAELAERDLAIAWPLDSDFMVQPDDVLADGTRALPAAWYEAVERGFAPTSVGDALQVENRRSDWRVVSIRVAPCAPYGATPAHDIERYCWPEVRLVWQPILHDVRIHERFSPAFADDRALHAIYPAPERVALSDAEARRARALRARVVAYAALHRGGAFEPLTSAERTELDGYRDRVAAAMLESTLALRDSTLSRRDYAGHGVRPETDLGVERERALRDRVRTFLGVYGRAQDLAKLTAFSLPEGREPAHLNEWVFLSFGNTGGRLVPERIVLTSARDGRTLFDFGTSSSSGMSTDDPRLEELADDPMVGAEIRESIILSSSADLARLLPVIRDRRQRLVPNTSCGSCHRLNGLRFDFHNFGYLEDRDLSIAPRVRTDVALDLAWIARLAGEPPPSVADAGTMDAGSSDASQPDAGPQVDAGTDAGPAVDAGMERTYSASPAMAIPDGDRTGIRHTIEVPDDIIASSVAVRVRITHPYRGDLVVALVRGTERVVLSSRAGGNARNLDQRFALPAMSGRSVRGAWTLEVQDLARADVGRLDTWSVEVVR